MAYKTFVNGFPLNASEINNNLMNQVISTFADSSARTTAITAPVEGQITYLTGTNDYWKYDGTSWVELVGLEEQVSQAISPNYIINGAFDVWQRGTSTTSSSDGYFTADRWRHNTGGGSVTLSRQSFTPGDIEAIGFGDAEFFLRRDSDGSASNQGIQGRIEDLRLLAGQTGTLSFWAKASAAASLRAQPFQNFGSGGSSTVFISAQDSSVTTSWQRFSLTYTIPSVSGKTIGSGNYFGLFLITPTATAATIDIWGVQLEAGSIATPFKRNAPNLQGELAACQRYYYRMGVTETSFRRFGTAMGATSGTAVKINIIFPTTMRSIPTSLEYSTLQLYDGTSFLNTISNITLDGQSADQIAANVTATGMTQFRPYVLSAFNTSAAFIAFSAEI